jgi:iron complex outermembrane receptor protein
MLRSCFVLEAYLIGGLRMNKKSLRVHLWTPVILGLALPQISAAQDEGNNVFEEITVTATKREQNIYDVPIAMSAFDGDNLAAQGITTINDIGKFVPNMNVTAFSAGHTSSINVFIRGIGIQDHLIAVDPGVSVSVDGVYLGRQFGQNWSLSSIERVEVLRGPQGTLYGRNSIGGAVNIITKTPGENPGATMSIEVGSEGRLNADFYADWNLSDNSALALSGGFRSRDGVGKFRNLPNAGVEVGEMQEVYGRLAYRYAPSDDFSIQIVADANNGKGGLRPYTTLIDELGAECRATDPDPAVNCLAVNGGPNGAVYDAGYRNSDVSSDPYDNNTGQANQTRVTNEASGIAITADWAFNDDLSGRVIASTRSSEYKSGLDDDSFVDDFLSFPETGEADQTSVEFQVNGDYGSWDFVSGLFYFEEDGGNFQIGYVFNGAGPFDFITEGEITSTAIFANVGYNVSDTLRVAVGARYTEDEKDASTQCCINPQDDGSADFDELSWDLSANWTMSNGLNIYGAIQNGYQSGQFPARPFCLFGDPNCFQATDNITAVNYEVGIKGQPTDWLQMSAAVFITNYSDLPYQVSSTSGGGFSTTAVVVDQTSTGFEWESTMLFGENFLLHATLGFIDVDVDRDAATGVKGVAPLTPELTWSLSPEYSVPLQNGGTVTIRADYSYRDDMWGEPSDDPGRMTQIESRDVINANIAYLSPDDSWSVALYGRNITDERYTNAMINVGDYILQILNNDVSEFGVTFTKSF